jgi:prepilin-type N-terminal cleavage/methylation domain-containing protein
MQKRFIGQKGDTIIEVLIAIAVMGTVIAGGFAIANRSMRGIRQAQERGEALKLAERQIERIKQYAPTNDNFFDSGEYCLNDDGLRVGYSPTPENCKTGLYTVTNSAAPVGSDPVGSDPVGSDTKQYIFTTKAEWDRVGGGGKDNVTVKYKVYK